MLPHGGSPNDPALERGQRVLDAENLYRFGNYAFVLAGMLLLGFLGVVHLRLRRADGTGVLATVALAAGTLLAVVWPLAAVLHDVALDTAADGTDLRILAEAGTRSRRTPSPSRRCPGCSSSVRSCSACASPAVAPWLQRVGVVLLPLSLLGSATLVAGAFFPLLALSTLGYELWVGAVAWHWLRTSR